MSKAHTRKSRRVVRSPWSLMIVALICIGALVWVIVVVAQYSHQVAVQDSQGGVLPPAKSETNISPTSEMTAAITPPTSSSPVRTTTSITTSTASASTTSVSTKKPVPVVAASDPQHLIFECSGKTVVNTVLQGMTYDEGVTNGDIHPPTGRIAYYLDNFGSMPRSPGSDSTFIFGHAWTRDAKEVFNPISEMAFSGRRQATDTKDRVKKPVPGYHETIPVDVVPDMIGCQYIVTTETGVFTYQVTEAFVVRKAQWQYVGDLAGATDQASGRLVVSTCLIDITQGVEKDWNVVTYARQVAARKI